MNSITTLYQELDGIEWGSYDPAGTLKQRTIRAPVAGDVVVAIDSKLRGCDLVRMKISDIVRGGEIRSRSSGC
ncbi:MAG: hypothetical protein ACT6Q8_11585 [Niveispirillum sp.]